MARHFLSDLLCGVLPQTALPQLPESALRAPCDADSNVGEYAHKHQCAECGNTWAHNDFVMQCANSEEHRIAHTCACCGAEQYWKHF